MAVVAVGVGGGIAAYKVCQVVRRLAENGHDVHVIPTDSALEFVGRPTWEALSGHSVHSGVFDDVPGVEHVRLGEQADLVLVAPTTADLLSRIAQGRGDDLLTTTILASRAPKLLVPAMHTAMWLNPATQENAAAARRHGIVVKEPARGRLTGHDSGPGRMPEPDEIVWLAQSLLDDPECAEPMSAQDLAGWRILVSAGGTREPIDPVRYIGNLSSGRMGFAIATNAAARGAKVTVVAAHTQAQLPSSVGVVTVDTTEDLCRTMTHRARQADAVVMAAAAADFAAAPATTKIKKHEGTDHVGESMTLELHQTPDVLAQICADPVPGRVVVGFAAETTDDREQLLHLADAKLHRKGCDVLIVNDVSAGRVFGSSDTDITVVHQQGPGRRVVGSKARAAAAIVDEIHQLLAQ
ncbi:bifunctional phosphopantothenoylcysteine decarboxylase/phosphopantothenate--cysteine ligase CoaBC [Cutibacterium granulosum]|uniref:bifunctional phosphopantothenoylcysteine decarboxylase/phosphopantothenate--cysteine ligase CoaBC n=1 Tax=Cutibacterium granulosum TaxID=33011 RepID=UPI0023F6FFDE|nr:bifunctional phosphopantothenoylcysteine decarboxylase/phosphopantothenate--cysteine ligase CoaBC [Cutibacterium granulosum]